MFHLTPNELYILPESTILFRTSNYADNEDLRSFQLEWIQQHEEHDQPASLYCSMDFIRMTVCIPMNLNKIPLCSKCDFILRGTAWTFKPNMFILLQIDFVFDAEELQELKLRLLLPQ